MHDDRDQPAALLTLALIILALVILSAMSWMQV